MKIEEIKENEKDINNTLDNSVIINDGAMNIEEKQNKFLEGTLGKVINTGVDIALRAILPNMIEDEVVRNKKCNCKSRF